MRSLYCCVLAIFICTASNTLAIAFPEIRDMPLYKIDRPGFYQPHAGIQESNFQKLCNISIKGNRKGKLTNNDRIISTQFQVKASSSPVQLFGVFGGHGRFEGSTISDWLKNNFEGYLARSLNSVQNLDSNSVKEAIRRAVYEADADICAKGEVEHGMVKIFSGSTASFFVTFDNDVFVVNIGDSRSIIYNADTGKFIRTKDHKPNDKEEKKHIEDNGGAVTESYGDMYGKPIKMYKVYQSLEMSRSFGDCFLKRVDAPKSTGYIPDGIVRITPDIAHYHNKKGDNLVLLSATRGLFDPFGSSEYIRNSLKSASLYSCMILMHGAVERGSKEDISIVMAKLNGKPSQQADRQQIQPANEQTSPVTVHPPARENNFEQIESIEVTRRSPFKQIPKEIKSKSQHSVTVVLDKTANTPSIRLYSDQSKQQSIETDSSVTNQNGNVFTFNLKTGNLPANARNYKLCIDHKQASALMKGLGRLTRNSRYTCYENLIPSGDKN